MKPAFLLRLLTLVLACSVPAFAGAGHDHAHHDATRIIGPNKGRVLTQFEPHAELFATPERRVRLTFVDHAGNLLTPPAGFAATLITGDRSAPVTLAFATDGESLLSTSALPAGGNLPAILRAKLTAESTPVTVRIQLNLEKCGTCERAEYACICAH